MDHKSVESSTLRSVAHDSETNTLEVKFKTGKTYQYDGVPSGLYNDLMSAPSAGKFLANHIKGTYTHREV